LAVLQRSIACVYRPNITQLCTFSMSAITVIVIEPLDMNLTYELLQLPLNMNYYSYSNIQGPYFSCLVHLYKDFITGKN